MNNGRNFFNGAGLDEMPQSNMNTFDNQGMMGGTPQPMDNGMGMNQGFNSQPMDMPMNNQGFNSQPMDMPMNNQGFNSQPMDMPMMNNNGMNNNGFIDMSQAVNMNDNSMMGSGMNDMPQPSMNTFDNQGMMGGTSQPMDNGMGMNQGFNSQPMDMPMMNDNAMNSNAMNNNAMNNNGMMDSGMNNMPQPAMNTFDNQGMMSGTPQLMDNGMGMNQGFNSQPMDMPMMNNNAMNNNVMNNNFNMGMQQPMMNNNMGMPQQNIVQPGSNKAPKGKFNFAENKGGILIAVASVALIAVLLVFFVFHKTLKCSADIADTDFGIFMGDMSSYGIEITVESKTEFWFGKPTSSITSMIVDFSDYDEEKMGMDLEDAKESLSESMGEDFDVKEKGDKLILTMETDKDDLEDSDTDYDELKDNFEDVGLTCK